jgi:hypothetical protein
MRRDDDAMIRHRKLKGFLLSILVAASSCASAADPDINETVRSLIGSNEFSTILPAPIGDTGCINEGGGLLLKNGKSFDEWSFGEATCSNRTVALLKRSPNSPGKHVDWRVVDAFLSPALRHGDEIFQQGDCELDGKTDTSFMAIVHLGRRERVGHRNGAKGAWTVDPHAGKIVALDTKRVVCYRPTPP